MEKRDIYICYARRTLLKEKSLARRFIVISAIYKGEKTRENLYNHFKSLYCAHMSYLKLTPDMLDGIIQTSINDGLIEDEQGGFSLTEKGKNLLEKANNLIMSHIREVKILLNEKTILFLSFLCLVFLSLLKLLLGLSSGSEALFSEGMENFTDIIKIFIIYLSMKFQKDRLGSIIIMIFMLLTGISLMITSIHSLINNEIIKPDLFTFIVISISIGLNYFLMHYKKIVGKLSVNFSLLTDAKDNINNMRLSIGVLIGLFFTLGGIYFIDSAIGIIISAIILYDGLITLRELIISGEDIKIDAFKLKIDEKFNNWISYWILKTIHDQPLSKENLNDKFIQALDKGYKYYDVFAIIEFYDIQKTGIQKILDEMEREGLFIQKDNKIFLTNKGITQYYKARAIEFKEAAKEYENFGKEFLDRPINAGTVS